MVRLDSTLYYYLSLIHICGGIRRTLGEGRRPEAQKRHRAHGKMTIIRETEEEAEVIPNLMIGFGIDQVQAEYVAEIKLRNINKEYILSLIHISFPTGCT